MKKTILITGGVLNTKHKLQLEAAGFILKFERSDLTENQLISALQGVSAYILAGAEKASRLVIESASDLRIIAFFGVGCESYIDVKAATEKGIAVTNAPGANAQSVAEFTIGLMLDAVKRSTFLIESAKHGDWQEYVSWNLHGRTLGIVGFGAIGARVARIAGNGFGMRILYTSRNRKLALESGLDAKFVKLPELLQTSDVVSLHTSLTDQTIGMIGAAELQLMKKTAVLINSSRAQLVDPKALYAILSKRAIACAAFDGYYIEPAPAAENDEYGLTRLPYDVFLMSPHAAYLTEDANVSTADMTIASILDIFEQRPVQHLINLDYRQYDRHCVVDKVN